VAGGGAGAAAGDGGGRLSPETDVNFAAAFRAGLSETGFVEGRIVSIEYCLTLNDYSRLQDLAADLERRRVSVIAATGAAAASRRRP
jgi:putative ABC transport system substrate-binding protein